MQTKVGLICLALILTACARCDGPPQLVEPEAVAESPPPAAEAAAAPPIAAQVPLRLVIRHPPAAVEVQDSPASCRPLGATSGPPVNGVSAAVAVGPAGAAALYPTSRLPNDFAMAALVLLAPDGSAREPTQLRIRGLIRRIDPLEEGFLIVTAYNDFSAGLVRRFHAYVVDGEGRFGGHVVVTAEGRGEIDGVGSAGEGALRFFFAPSPSQDDALVMVDVRRDESGALTRTDEAVRVHVPERGAPGRSMVVALPPAEAAVALVLHPDSGAELLRGAEASPIAALRDVRGSWLLGNPVRAVASDEETLLHIVGDGGGLFVVDGGEVRAIAGDPEPATTLGEHGPVVVRVVNGALQLEPDESAGVGEIAWYGTTMAQLVGERLIMLECGR